MLQSNSISSQLLMANWHSIDYKIKTNRVRYVELFNECGYSDDLPYMVCISTIKNLIKS